MSIAAVVGPVELSGVGEKFECWEEEVEVLLLLILLLASISRADIVAYLISALELREGET